MQIKVMASLLHKTVPLLRNVSKNITVRWSSTEKGTSLVYDNFGDPVSVIRKVEVPVECPKDDQLLLKVIAAPINPADINTIEGKYPAKPSSFPAVPGNEGVGQVVALGKSVKNFAIGDRVIPLTNMLGTWRSHMIINANEAFAVPQTLGLIEASTLTVNPCTAYRMLKDFVALQKDDVVLQNGANSACGQYVIQLCNHWGVKSVNIVRDRPNIAELKGALCELGATLVLTEEELRKTQVFKSGEYKKPKLALNCVGGKSALELLRHLEKGGVMVTYGGMSKEPVTVPTSALIFKDIQVRGYWMTEWVKKNAKHPERFNMLKELVQLMECKKLIGPMSKLVDINEFKKALEQTTNPTGKGGEKLILSFDGK